ncbi:MAG: hypothetical protein WC641_04610 [Patescibacteria group bacterium]
MEDAAKQEILEAIGEFAGQVDQRFDRIESEIGGMKSEIGGMKTEIGSMKSDIVSIKATMVTKSYLDDKLADLKGDMVSMLRKEDQKVNRLVCVMAGKGSLTSTETRDVLSFRPFP